jgi:hypothetical protein
MLALQTWRLGSTLKNPKTSNHLSCEVEQTLAAKNLAIQATAALCVAAPQIYSCGPQSFFRICSGTARMCRACPFSGVLCGELSSGRTAVLLNQVPSFALSLTHVTRNIHQAAGDESGT